MEARKIGIKFMLPALTIKKKGPRTTDIYHVSGVVIHAFVNCWVESDGNHIHHSLQHWNIQCPFHAYGENMPSE